MRSVPVWVAAMAAAAAGLGGETGGAPNRLTAEERRAGWQLLFDGKTLKGWNDPAKKTPPGDSCRVEDGWIRVVGGARIREDLVSDATFEDFELTFEWKIAPGANSGVKYRIQDSVLLPRKPEPGVGRRFEEQVNWHLTHKPYRRDQVRPGELDQDYVVAFEYQVIDDARNPDALRGAKQRSGALYNLIGPEKSAARPAGEINQGRIVVRGNHAEHWLNGVKVMDSELDAEVIREGLKARWGEGRPVYELLVKQPRRRCPIGLQNHASDAWFRSLKIRALR